VNIHVECTHARIGFYAVYCPKTGLVYINPCKVPTPRGKRERPDEWAMFCREAKGVAHAMRGIPINGFVLLHSRLSPPVGKKTLLDHMALRRWLEHRDREDDVE
jgi:hypothetical protein